MRVSGGSKRLAAFIAAVDISSSLFSFNLSIPSSLKKNAASVVSKPETKAMIHTLIMMHL